MLTETSPSETKPDVWETRYFPAQLPDRFVEFPLRLPQECKYDITLRKILMGRAMPFHANDVYIISSDQVRNIKVRRQTGTFKVKLMLDRTADDFELWHIEIECALTDFIKTGSAATSVLKLQPWIGLFSLCKDSHEFSDKLTELYPTLVMPMRKQGTRYASLGTQLEIAEVEIGGRMISSVSFESPDLEEARALRKILFTESLGPPTNYANLCRDIQSGKQA
jgi:hypothetical protein